MVEAALRSRRTATGIGFLAVLMWAFLALLSVAAGPIPPFQMTAMTFLLGGLFGASTWLFRPGAVRGLRQPWPVWALGTCGLCGYHVCYFFAIQSAPPAEASLIAYLWPLLIVVFSAFLPGVTLRVHHAAGAALGLAGAIIVITRGGQVALSDGLQPGHLIALACAFIWSGYSVLSRRFGAVPSDIVAGFCLITAAVAFALHLVFEETLWPATGTQWIAVTLLGVLPLGAGFYAWDIGVKHGDIMVLGAASYSAPLLSTLVLLAAGYAPYDTSLLVACLLITIGALIAAKDMLHRR